MNLMGVDVGGSTTRLVLLDADYRLIGHAKAPGCATADRSAEAPVAHLKDAIRALVGPLAGTPIRVTVNLAGDNVRQVAGSILEAAPNADVRVFRETEGDVPLFLARLFDCSVVVLAGTGTVALGEKPDGKRWVSGGFGCAFGDEGSGYWIGRLALKAALEAIDGRRHSGTWIEIPEEVLPGGDPAAIRPAADLAPVIERRLAIRKWMEGLTRSEVAAFARAVVARSREGVAEAREILRQAGRELAHLTCAVADRLDLEQPVGVLVTGGLAHAWEFIEPSMTETLGAYGRFRLQPFVAGGLATAAALVDAPGVTADTLVDLERGTMASDPHVLVKRTHRPEAE